MSSSKHNEIILYSWNEADTFVAELEGNAFKSFQCFDAMENLHRLRNEP